MRGKEKFGLQNENKIIKSTSFWSACALLCVYSRMRPFLSLPTYEGALDLSRHPPPAATKPFVRACLFLRALRVWPCLEHHLDSYSDSVSRCLSSSLGGKMLAFCLTFIQFAFVPPADHFPVSLCLCFCRSSVNIPYLLYTILDMCFPSLIPFLFELFNYLLVFFSSIYFSFSSCFSFPIFVAHLSGFAFCSSSLYW